MDVERARVFCTAAESPINLPLEWNPSTFACLLRFILLFQGFFYTQSYFKQSQENVSVSVLFLKV